MSKKEDTNYAIREQLSKAKKSCICGAAHCWRWRRKCGDYQTNRHANWLYWNPAKPQALGLTTSLPRMAKQETPMMTLHNFPNQPRRQPVRLEGPYRRKTISFNEFLISAIGHIAIVGILIYALLGMAGVVDGL